MTLTTSSGTTYRVPDDFDAAPDQYGRVSRWAIYGATRSENRSLCLGRNVPANDVVPTLDQLEQTERYRRLHVSPDVCG